MTNTQGIVSVQRANIGGKSLEQLTMDGVCAYSLESVGTPVLMKAIPYLHVGAAVETIPLALYKDDISLTVPHSAVAFVTGSRRKVVHEDTVVYEDVAVQFYRKK